jgi:hypothetical protein
MTDGFEWGIVNAECGIKKGEAESSEHQDYGLRYKE